MWVNAMIEDTRNLTALQMLAQLNQAIEEAGLHEMHKQRQPLEIFHNLLQDWYLSKELPSEGKNDNEIFIQLLKRSEEHTSELQSRPHLVCRLLLENCTSAT